MPCRVVYEFNDISKVLRPRNYADAFTARPVADGMNRRFFLFPVRYLVCYLPMKASVVGINNIAEGARFHDNDARIVVPAAGDGIRFYQRSLFALIVGCGDSPTCVE
jgi:hypothetical protein